MRRSVHLAEVRTGLEASDVDPVHHDVRPVAGRLPQGRAYSAIGAQFACIEVARVFNVTSAQTARRFDEVDLGQSATSPQEVRKLLLLINADQAQPTPTQVSKYGV